MLCKPAIPQESDFVSKIKLSELPEDVVSLPEHTSSEQDLKFPAFMSELPRSAVTSMPYVGLTYVNILSKPWKTLAAEAFMKTA